MATKQSGPMPGIEDKPMTDKPLANVAEMAQKLRHAAGMSPDERLPEVITPPHRAPVSAAIESVLITGDLAKLTPDQRVSYYKHVCESLGLNPLTKPFSYIILNGKLTLYALKDCTEQLRSIHGVSITALTSQKLDDVFVVTANASRRDGRTDAATGAVAIGGFKGEALANALMKAETKAKRRATLSICGLGMLDETEAVDQLVRETQPVDTATFTVDIPALPPVPDRYDEWLADMEATADLGIAKLQDAWNKSPHELRAHIRATDSQRWMDLKAKAAKATPQP